MTNKLWFIPALLIVVVAALMLATAPYVPDEYGERFKAADDVQRPLISEMLARAGQHRTFQALPTLTRYRFFPCILFALATAAMFLRLRSTYPRSVAFIGVFLLLTLPREFAAAHAATGPMLAGSCLLLGWSLFPEACRSLVGLVCWLLVCSISGMIDFQLCLIMPFTATQLLNRNPGLRVIALGVLSMGMICLIGSHFTLQAILRFDPDFLRSGMELTRPALFEVNWRELATELLGCPEWHLLLAFVGIWKIFRFSEDDIESLGLVGSAVATACLLEGPPRLIFIAPIAALGAGRMLYRGTLTKSFRIPPASWAMVLLAVVTIRSIVIMITWAPNWQDYQNRIGLLLAP